MAEDHMARDVEVLRRVMDFHGMTVAHLADRSGLSEKYIYKCLADVKRVPSEVLTAAYELTDDLRIVQIITRARPLMVLACAATRPQCECHGEQTAPTAT
jgi:hypothetical protein